METVLGAFMLEKPPDAFVGVLVLHLPVVVMMLLDSVVAEEMVLDAFVVGLRTPMAEKVLQALVTMAGPDGFVVEKAPGALTEVVALDVPRVEKVLRLCLW